MKPDDPNATARAVLNFDPDGRGVDARLSRKGLLKDLLLTLCGRRGRREGQHQGSRRVTSHALPPALCGVATGRALVVAEHGPVVIRHDTRSEVILFGRDYVRGRHAQFSARGHALP